MDWRAEVPQLSRDQQYEHLIAESDIAEEAGNVRAATWLRERATAVWEEIQVESQPFVA